MPGFWRPDTSSLRVFACPSAASCTGGSHGFNGTGCLTGSHGPLCAVCKDGFAKDSGSGLCNKCPAQGATKVLFGVVFALLLILFVAFAVFVYVLKNMFLEHYEWFEQVVLPKIRILVSHMQVISGFQYVIDVQWAPAVASTMSVSSVAEMSILSLGFTKCVVPVGYVGEMMGTTSIAFIAMTGMLVTTFFLENKVARKVFKVCKNVLFLM